MTSKTEQFYIRHIAELEEQLKQRDERIAVLEKQVAELIKVNAELADKVAKLSKNSSNSSKPPSSDIVKPEKYSITNNREIVHRFFRFCTTTIFLSSIPRPCITGAIYDFSHFLMIISITDGDCPRQVNKGQLRTVRCLKSDVGSR